jgi:hypothetical protein
MGHGLFERVLGAVFLVGGVVASVLLVALLATPVGFGEIRPLALVVLLALTALVAFRQAAALLR